MAAWGVALAGERVAAWLGERDAALVRRVAGFLEPRRMDRPV